MNAVCFAVGQTHHALYACQDHHWHQCHSGERTSHNRFQAEDVDDVHGCVEVLSRSAQEYSTSSQVKVCRRQAPAVTTKLCSTLTLTLEECDVTVRQVLMRGTGIRPAT